LKAHIIVLNYNGIEIMNECIASVLKAARNSKKGCLVTVLDNKSTDESLPWLKSHYPEINIVVADENRVLCSYNKVVESIEEEVVILLNNDIKLDANAVDPLIAFFEDNNDAFFVASKVFDFSGKKYEGNLTRFFFRWGFFGAEAQFKGHERLISSSGLSMQQGFGAFSRVKFVELGGYDDIYLPGRLEDSDICFRAWKRGWKGYYEPESVMLHKGGESFKKDFGIRKTLVMNFKNTYLFICKNLSWEYVVLSLVMALPRNLVFLLKGRPEFFMGFLQSLPRIAEAIRRRDRNREAVYSDKELFEMVKETE